MNRLVIVKRLLDTEAGRRQPGSVLVRLATWQLWRRAFRRPMKFRTVTGTSLLLLPGASDSLSGFWYHQVPDFNELAFSLHLLRAGELFVDIGANQGGWSLTVAGIGARVISFEPVPATYRRLQANVSVNSPATSGRIKALPVGLGERDAQVQFTCNLDAGNHRVRQPAAAEEEVVTADITTADAALYAEDPVLLKIDVEGEERRVLEGGRAILQKPSLLAVVMETFRPHNHAEPDLIAIEALLREHGFMPMDYNPWTRELRPLRDPSDGSQNTIYVRNPEEVALRLIHAPTFRALGRAI